MAKSILKMAFEEIPQIKEIMLQHLHNEPSLHHCPHFVLPAIENVF